MSRLFRWSMVAAVLATGACTSAVLRSDRPTTGLGRGHLPTPTEHWLDEQDEANNRAAREAWIEEMHRAGPDVDWQAVERENGRREMQRRANLPLQRATRWTEIGSRNQAGRMMCAMLGPDSGDGRKLYAGSALGGLWRGNPDGSGWEPLGDNLYGGVEELLAIAGELPGDPDIVFVASSTDSVFVTRDDGWSWQQPPGLEGLVSVRSVGLIHGGPVEEMLVYGVADIVGVGRRGAVFASVDRGLTFQKRHHFGADWEGDMALASNATASSPIFVIHKGKCFRSFDKGLTFTKTVDIQTTATKGVVALSPSGGPHLYTALQVGSNWELYRSNNGGNSFSYLQSLTDFWEVMMASPLDPNVLIYGGVEAWRSMDQGNTFQKVNAWGDYYASPHDHLHADMMGLHAYLDPDDPGKEIMFFSTDGGVYRSEDAGQSVVNLSLTGLGVSQYYSTLTSVTDPDLIQAGSQDQGFQRGFRQDSLEPGPSTDFEQLISGDYGHLTSWDGSHDVVFATYPGFVLISEGEVDPILHSTPYPSGASNLWLPPVVADPGNPNNFYFLGNHLWRGVRSGNLWAYVQASARNFAAGAGNYLTRMAFAPSDPSRAYAVNDAGFLYYSADGATSWNLSVHSAPPEHFFYGNALAVHPTNPMEAYVGGSGYSGVAIRKTTDGGVSWSAMDEGLPNTLVYDLAYSHDGTDVYAGTETGAFRLGCLSSKWQNILEARTPITAYWSVEAVPGTPIMRFGTYGRGIWDYKASELPPLVLFSVKKTLAVVDGTTLADGDVAQYDCVTGTVSQVLDLSDLVTRPVDVDALAMLEDGSFLLSFTTAGDIDGLKDGPQGELVMDEDIVRFVPTMTGEATDGHFEFYFDGSDVGLRGAEHDIDALGIDAEGNLHLSLAGNWKIHGTPDRNGTSLSLSMAPPPRAVQVLEGNDEDILQFSPKKLGADTRGTFSLLLDGSAPQVRLANVGENVDAYHYDLADGSLTFSTEGNHSVPINQTGQSNDLITFVPSSLGETPTGIWIQLFDGSQIQVGSNIDALHIIQ